MKAARALTASALLALGFVPIAHGAAVQPLEISLQFVGPTKPTSFPQLLYMHVTNPGYLPVEFAKAIMTSKLIIDGKPSTWSASNFMGPQGLAALGEWDGCFSFSNFTPMITPGTHKISFQMSGMQTPPARILWIEPVDWRKGNMKTRLKEIELLALAMDDGLPQSCVEQWLTVKDGGQQDEDKVRYYLEPQFKMSVPYRQMYQASVLHAVVDGTPTIYKEQRLTD